MSKKRLDDVKNVSGGTGGKKDISNYFKFQELGESEEMDSSTVTTPIKTPLNEPHNMKEVEARMKDKYGADYLHRAFDLGDFNA